MLRYMKKQELKEQYARNTLGLMLRALWPKLDRALYSEFVESLEGPTKESQKERDERERKQVYDWLMGGDTEDGSIHTHCEAGT